MSVLDFDWFIQSGADLRGRGGGGFTPFLRDSTPCRPKGSAFETFKKSSFGRPTLKYFLRRLWRQYILILREEHAPKNAIFL